MQGSSDPNRELLDATAFCRHLVEKGSVADFLTDHRQELFPDELFSDLFPSDRGRPSVPADVVATVMVLQSLEGLSDRDAARQLRTNIAWKVATGMALDDAGFHPTVLTLWRNRLRASARPQRIFDAVREGAIDRPMRVFTPAFGAGAVGGYTVIRIDPAIVVPERAEQAELMTVPEGNAASSLEDVRAAFGG